MELAEFTVLKVVYIFYSFCISHHVWAPYKYSFALHDWSLLNRADTMGLSGLHDIRNTNCVSFVVASEWTNVSYFGEEKKHEKNTRKKHTRGNPLCKPASFQCEMTTKPSVFDDSLFTLCKWMGMTGFIGGGCHKYHFCCDKCFFRDKHATKHILRKLSLRYLSLAGAAASILCVCTSLMMVRDRTTTLSTHHLCVHQPNDAKR